MCSWATVTFSHYRETSWKIFSVRAYRMHKNINAAAAADRILTAAKICCFSNDFSTIFNFLIVINIALNNCLTYKYTVAFFFIFFAFIIIYFAYWNILIFSSFKISITPTKKCDHSGISIYCCRIKNTTSVCSFC